MPKAGRRKRNLTVTFSYATFNKMEQLVDKNYFSSKSELIRAAVEKFLERYYQLGVIKEVEEYNDLPDEAKDILKKARKKRKPDIEWEEEYIKE